MHVGIFYLFFWKTSFSSVCVFRVFCLELNVLNQYFNQATLYNELKRPCSTYVIKGEDTLWNISFRLLYETQFNSYVITFNLISWNSYEVCKKEISTNYYKKKNKPYLHVCHISMLWILVDLFLMKRLFSQETVFFKDYFTRDKSGFVHYRIQVLLCNK